MNQLQIYNCTGIQETILRFKLSKVNIPQGKLKIFFKQDIPQGRCYSCWYGGEIVSIRYKNYDFTISAEGDMIADLQSKVDLHEIVRVKDKSNAGIFMAEMNGYIEDDNRLRDIMSGKDSEYILSIEQNNWFEMRISDTFGYIDDFDPLLDSEQIFDAVAEVVDSINAIIKVFEEQQPA